MRFKMPSFSPDQMKNIGDIVSAINRKIELNKTINHNLEAMAKQLYDYWFVQFDFPDETGRPYKSSGGRMVYNEKLKRRIPECFEITPLKNFLLLDDHKRIPLSNAQRAKMRGKIPYYGATRIMDYVNDYLFDGDYILLAEDGSTSDAEGFPIVQYIWGKTWVNNHAHIVLPQNERLLLYTYQMLRTIPAKKIETGSIQKKISQENLLGYNVAIPNKEIAELYCTTVKPLWEMRKKSISEINVLTKLRDELLPLLMNGQVSVNYDLSDPYPFLFRFLTPMQIIVYTYFLSPPQAVERLSGMSHSVMPHECQLVSVLVRGLIVKWEDFFYSTRLAENFAKFSKIIWRCGNNMYLCGQVTPEWSYMNEN